MSSKMGLRNQQMVGIFALSVIMYFRPGECFDTIEQAATLDVVCDGQVSIEGQTQQNSDHTLSTTTLYRTCGKFSHKCDLRYDYCDVTGTCYPCSQLCKQRQLETSAACQRNCQVYMAYQAINELAATSTQKSECVHSTDTTLCDSHNTYYKGFVIALVSFCAVSSLVNVLLLWKCLLLKRAHHTRLYQQNCNREL